MQKKHTEIPKDFPVQPVDPKDAKDPATCGYCGLTWDDALSTQMTPAPSGRCPFEYFHIHTAEGEDHHWKSLAGGVFTFLDVALGYLTQKDKDLLLAADPDFPLPAVYPYADGFFVHSGRIYVEEAEWRTYMAEQEAELEAFGMSQTFIKIWKYAIELDCWFVRFDVDGEVYEEFDSENSGGQHANHQL